jgi:hypothetical protein
VKPPQLFISHASEDKDAIGRPLAHALSEDFNVWFDEYVLNVGDSLREKIDDGLRKSDFGIVILSKSFFAKKWPRAELDGLLALESANRKLILPVWHGVTESEVKSFSPLLAGVLGVSTNIGVPGVVEALRRSITASTRTRDIALSSAGTTAALMLARKITSKDKEEQFYRTESGVAVLKEEAARIVEKIIHDVQAANDAASKTLFHVERRDGHELVLYGPHRIYLQTFFEELYLNSATRANFCAGFGKSTYIRGQYNPLHEMKWQPRYQSDLVRWQEEESRTLDSPEKVADRIVVKLTELIDEEIQYSSEGPI